MTIRILALAAVLGAVLAAAPAYAADDWKHITAENNENLPHDEIQILVPSRAGGVWVGTLQGITHYQDGELEPLPPQKSETKAEAPKKKRKKNKKKEEEKFLKVKAWDILEEKDGTLWIGHGGGLLRRKGETDTSFNAISLTQEERDKLKEEGKTPPGNSVAPIHRFGEDKMVVLAKNLATEWSVLCVWDGEAWSPVERYAKERIAQIHKMSDGSLWIVVEGDGVLVATPEDGLGEPAHHLRGQNVSAVAEDAKGRIWCGLVVGGVEVYEGKTWTSHLEDIEAAIMNIVQSGDGRVWVATNAVGLFSTTDNGETWQQFFEEDGAISLLTTTRDDTVWVSAKALPGLRRWTGGEFVVSLASPLPIRCVAQTDDGTVVAGGVLDGLHILEDGVETVE